MSGDIAGGHRPGYPCGHRAHDHIPREYPPSYPPCAPIHGYIPRNILPLRARPQPPIIPPLRLSTHESQMPITQDRMFALVSAAQDYASGLRDLCRAIQRGYELQSGLPASSQNWALAYAEILGLASEAALLSQPVISGSTIVVESEHIRRSRRGNARASARKRRQRAEVGTSSRATAPGSPVYGAPSLGHLARAVESTDFGLSSGAVRHTRTGQQPPPPVSDDPLEQFKAGLSPEDLRKLEEMIAAPAPPSPTSLAPFLDLAPSAPGEDDLDLSGLVSESEGEEKK